MTGFAQPAAGWMRPPVPPPAGSLAASVIDTVKHAAAAAPRSVQQEVGPSEIGTPCVRRLGYRMLDWDPKPNRDTDPWAATIGTAVHAWMASTYEAENTRLGRERYLVEHRVHLPGGISGCADLFDRDTGGVRDWKITGPERLKGYRKNGPGDQYRAQAHLYGLGLQLAGETVREVAIVFLPRGGRIDALHVWSETYDPLVAVAALKRYRAVWDFHMLLDPETHPGRWAMLPTADAYCTYCPWFLPGSRDLSQGCPGHNTTPERR